ncbi:hypothetical protein L0657_24220 [Dyadobacter sp. CY345]|uniref:hypothetical protein n=1 Tax=Dyadobacter sp. CY345 TaxID=2909335 RepID=UPI001F2EA288|nr:hypothetical protein [Dyadobacter sp. CY345]MCF2447082.1 hypothetical protein [Dyadobacter sp. CY345]
MNTLPFIKDGYVQSRRESITSSANLGSFIPPMTIILTVATVLITSLIISLYLFPEVSVSVLVLGGLAWNKYVKRSHLTFFSDGYAPDIYVEEIENHVE